MKSKLLLVLVLLVSAATHGAFAQTGSVRGTILDDDTGEGLVGANVVLKGTSTGSVTNTDGTFVLENLAAGRQVIVISSIGYATKEIPVQITDGSTTDLGTVRIGQQAVGLQEVEVIASMAIDRKTPVAVSTISGSLIEQKVGNQEFPEVIKYTPSIYVTKTGGGFGDSRINVRGFDQRNVAVMINGIPVNDMENGWVYWSNWAGLSDVSSNIQIQRGLGASKLAVPSVGGSINIITNAAERKKGGALTTSFGNNGYMKYALTYSTGLMENGWAASVQTTHTRGDGYVDGTMFRGYSYFMSLAKVFNSKHSLNFTAFGAPQWHNQRTFPNSYETYMQRGTTYNDSWGYLDGEEFNIRKNFYHKPQISLNHYWNITDKTELATSVYVSFGRGGGTGDLGRINGSAYFSSKFKDSDNLLRLEDIRKWNSGQSVPDFGADPVPWAGSEFNGDYVGQSSSSGIIRRSSMNEHNWVGMISNLTSRLSDNWTLVGGLDLRHYRGLHYRRVENLLGLDAYYDDDDINNPDHYVTAEGRASGNQIDYNNDGLVTWIGLYGQLEYTKDKVSAFLSFSGSEQAFKRIDYFTYLDSDPLQETPWINYFGGTIKTGLNYNINDVHNIYVNGGYFSRQPIFDNVFPFFTNEINFDAKNQSVYAIEVGWGIRSQALTANLNVYHTQWGNRQFTRSGIDGDNDGQFDDLAIFNNVAQLHQGVELDIAYRPMTGLTFNAMLSAGNWRYTDNFQATVVDENFDLISADIELVMDGVKVADAAQFTYSIGATYDFLRKASIYASYYYADNVFANFGLAEFVGQKKQVWQLPGYGLMDLGASYSFEVGKLDFRLFANINNVLDKEYIAESASNTIYSDSDALADTLIPGSKNGSSFNGVYYGFGRTWNAGLKIRF